MYVGVRVNCLIFVGS